MKRDMLTLALLLLALLPVLHAGEHRPAEHMLERRTPKERAVGIAAEFTPTELVLKKLLGAGTPDPIRLWPDKPPRCAENAPPETVAGHARIRMISVPTISPYLPPKDKRTGMAIIVCPGGGYGGMDWKTHVVYAAQVFNAKGVTVIGSKYRTRPPHAVDNAGIQQIALLNAKRAVRVVRLFHKAGIAEVLFGIGTPVPVHRLLRHIRISVTCCPDCC